MESLFFFNRTNVSIVKTEFLNNSADSQIATLRIKARNLILINVKIQFSNLIERAEQSQVTFMSFRTATIVNSLFIMNRSGQEGALFLLNCKDADLIMVNNVFYGNKGDTGAAFNVGPASNFSIIYIFKNIFHMNRATSDGGAIYISKFSFFLKITVDYCSFGNKNSYSIYYI